MKPKRAVIAKTPGAQFLHPRPIRVTLPRYVHDLEIQDQDAFVHDLVMLEVADQRGGDIRRMTGQEHPGAGHPIGILQQL